MPASPRKKVLFTKDGQHYLVNKTSIISPKIQIIYFKLKSKRDEEDNPKLILLQMPLECNSSHRKPKIKPESIKS